MKRCSRCVTPETHETIIFDEQGVCNICRQLEYKSEKIDWQAREKELLEIIEKYQGKHDYDCIIPFSGGKDSTFTLYKLVKDYKLKPLVVSFDHAFLRPQTLANNTRTMRKLGVDFLKFTPNWSIVKQAMRESLLRKGDFCWHCHTGIFAYPMQVAIKYNIPLILWGEPSAEYTSYYSYENPEEVDEKRFNRYTNLGIAAQDMQGMLGDQVTEQDLAPFTYPRLKDLRKIGYRSVCLGSFIPWDVKKQVEIIKRELDWQEDLVEGIPPGYGYEKVECKLQGIRDFCKFIKRGYARTSHLTSIDIRNNRLDRKKAMDFVEKYEGKRPASLDYFLNLLEISEDEFFQTLKKHIVSPWNWQPPESYEKGDKLPDQDDWL
jgi:N-acetyl sugar amidotransferase